MEQKNLTVISERNQLLVTLANTNIEHLGTAVVVDGHLFLRGNASDQFCQTSAVYAPGEWKSAVAINKIKGVDHV
jgi:hypothetical protein